MSSFGKMLALTFSFLLITINLFLIRPVFSQQTFTTPPVYEITPGIIIQPVPSGERGFVFFTKEFDLDYKGGKVMFSSNPDGTGNTLVDDAIQIRVNKSIGGVGVLTHEYQSGCTILLPGPPRDLSNMFTLGVNRVKILLFDVCGAFKSSTPLYLVTENLTPTPSPTLSPSASPSPSPSPSGPEPFLDLPWDYSSSDKDFKQIVFNPNSWFDHKYPLQNYSSNTLGVVKFTGKSEDDFYKSHSGYDYGSPHGVVKNTPVLAAAAGTAIFISEDNSGGAGNMIKIDHGNGYQTWYEHLEEIDNDGIGEDDQLILDEEDQEVEVEKGEKIGRVGLTGNTSGYHIHLSVFRDINDNDDFTDDKPFGLVDPLGWEGDYTDPWEEYSVTDENKVTRYGAKSYKLFTELLPPKTQTITPIGGIILSDKFKITVPSNALNQNATFKIDFGPFEKASNIIQSVVPSLFLSASNNFGLAITNFNNPLGLIYDYSKADLSNVNEDSLSFYFFNPVTNLWEKLSSSLDKTNKTISSQTSHFSQFAVMAELLDTSPPETEAHLTGDKGQGNWYRSNVIVTLLAEDNSGGKGVDYSVYSLDGEDWHEYGAPLVIEDEGIRKIYFLSHDNVGNQEEVKTIEFSIDKTIPEAKVFIDLNQFDLLVQGIDDNSTTVARTDNLVTKKKDDSIYTISDLAGNSLKVDVRDREKDKKDQFRIYSLQYNLNPPVILEPNQFNVSYQDKKEAANVKEQIFKIKDEVKIRIQYDAKKNQSTVITKDAGAEKIKEIKPGLSLLWLKTNLGKLEYGY